MGARISLKLARRLEYRDGLGRGDEKLLISEQKVRVDIESGRVRVLGRTYEVEHVLVVGASHIEASIEGSNLRISLYFSVHPQIDEQSDLVKVSKAGAVYEVNTSGDDVRVKEEAGEISLEGGVVSIKFEADDDTVVVKVPQKGKIRAAKLELKGGGNVSLNIITRPFIVGILSVKNARIKLAKKDDSIVVEALKG